MTALTARIGDDMAAERKEIDSMERWSRYTRQRQVPVTSPHPLVNWRRISGYPRSTSTTGVAGDGEAGWDFLARTGPRRQLVRFERGKADPLMPPRLLALSGRSVRPAMMEGGLQPDRDTTVAQDPHVPRRTPLLRDPRSCRGRRRQPGAGVGFLAATPRGGASRGSTSAWITWQKRISTELCKSPVAA